LHRHWVHAAEEDSPTESVFRPAGYPLPRVRGREGFELLPDGRLVEYSIGPTDRREKREGRWELDAEDRLILQRRGAAQRIVRVVSADADRLVFARPEER